MSHLYLLVLAAMLVVTGVSFSMMGLLGHLIGVNRMQCEEILFRLRTSDCRSTKPDVVSCLRQSAVDACEYSTRV